MPEGWVGFDLDGTLAHYTNWAEQGNAIGAPIPRMIDLLKKTLADGYEVRIFTARKGQDILIHQWLARQGLPPLEVTDRKDPMCVRIYDDRAVQVIRNEGALVGGETEIYRLQVGALASK